ncbi:homeobox protein CDX-2 [Crotalus adamanteus]|uniref:Homeobox protein CDX-2 n=1 Tax=Crotalus adamanteus TaxID=8729 RepID=A0AAW1BK53_CROAD
MRGAGAWLRRTWPSSARRLVSPERAFGSAELHQRRFEAWFDWPSRASLGLNPQGLPDGPSDLGWAGRRKPRGKKYWKRIRGPRNKRRVSGPRCWMKTRTKDKYRVVYTDHQRLELEKEFHYSRYITIRRKAELAATLGLSERQVKIWFQNRRAKERKINKKKLQQSQLGGVHSGSEPMSPVSSMQAGTPGSVPSGGVLGATGLTPTVAQ